MHTGLKVALICTRDLDRPYVGRAKTVRAVKEALEQVYDVSVLRAWSLLERPSVVGFVRTGLLLAQSLLRLRPVAIQSALYGNPSERARLTRELLMLRPDLIYLDMERLQLLLRDIKRHLPDIPIVLDLDDLLSRRYLGLRRAREPVAVGVLGSGLPGLVKSIVQTTIVSRAIALYEGHALSLCEREALRETRAVVLVSRADAQALRRMVDGPTDRTAAVCVIPPPAPVCKPQKEIQSPFRFVFVGSDRLAQNRSAISILVDLWRQLQPAASLYIVGEMTTRWPAVRGIHFPGFLRDLDGIYSADSVVLVPSLVEGGVKTKVLEAFAHGRPVLGTPLAFEGLNLSGYPLVRPVDAWAGFLTKPEAHREHLALAAAIGHDWVMQEATFERFSARWRRVCELAYNGGRLDKSTGLTA